MGIGAWWMLDCVGLKVVFCEAEGEGEDKAHHMSTVMFFRENSDPFYVLDNQGHCDTVLSKKTFFKSFPVLWVKTFL